MRPHYTWKVGNRRLELGRRTLVMGVVNVTPDSFSDGGQFRTAEEAVAHGLRLLEEGADLLDVGGESTRPGTRVGTEASVSATEELDRVLPVIEGLKRARADALVSVDTYKADVAQRSVSAGAEIVNDVSGLRWDRNMAETLSSLDCGVVLMHTRGTPEEWASLPSEPKIVDVVIRELTDIAGKAKATGIAQERVVLDPGFGFGKRMDDNYPLLARLKDLEQLGYPLLVGLSRKGFLGRTAGKRLERELAANERTSASVAAAVIAAMHGAHIVRAHDVRATVEALAIADSVQEIG